jgi:hypothetical protein
MTLDTPHVLLLLGALAAILFLIHRFAPTSAVAKAEDKAIGAVKTIEPVLESMGMQVLTDAEMWVTNTSSKDAAIAKLQAEKAAIIAAARAHVARVLSALPPV